VSLLKSESVRLMGVVLCRLPNQVAVFWVTVTVRGSLGHSHGQFIWMNKIGNGPASNLVQDNGWMNKDSVSVSERRQRGSELKVMVMWLSFHFSI
jgi:hypothetical protein